MAPETENSRSAFTEIVQDIPRFYDKFGPWQAHFFQNNDGAYWARTVGDLKNGEPIVLRIDDHCMTGFDLGHISSPDHPDAACDCVQQSEISRAYIQRIGRGVVIHTPFEARGHGPLAKARQLKLQGEAMERGEPMPDTYQCFIDEGFVPPDIRDYRGVHEILDKLGLVSAAFTLLTNNDRKVDELRKLGIKITGQINVYDPELVNYYRGGNFLAKVTKFGHEAPPSEIPKDGLVFRSF